MKNLHLKNLKEIDLFDLNMEQITKIENELEDKIYSLIKNTLQYLINQLENIKIVDPTIKEFKDYYLNDIKTNKFYYLTRKQLQNIKEFLNELENIKNLTIGSTINIKDYEYSTYYDDNIDKTVYEVDLMNAFLTDSAPGEILILEVEVVNNKIREITYHP
jgi:hypothetical protein